VEQFPLKTTETPAFCSEKRGYFRLKEGFEFSNSPLNKSEVLEHSDEAIIELNALNVIRMSPWSAAIAVFAEAPVFWIRPVAVVFVIVDETVHVASALDVHDVLDIGENAL